MTSPNVPLTCKIDKHPTVVYDTKERRRIAKVAEDLDLVSNEAKRNTLKNRLEIWGDVDPEEAARAKVSSKTRTKSMIRAAVRLQLLKERGWSARFN